MIPATLDSASTLSRLSLFSVAANNLINKSGSLFARLFLFYHI